MPTCNASSVKNNGNFVAFLHVLGTCDDLNCLCSDINLTDNELVCIGMLLDCLDLSYNDLLKVLIKWCVCFCFGSGKGHCIEKFLIGA